MRPRTMATGASAMIFLLLSAVGATAATGIQISGFAFAPGYFSVEVGEAITWTNADPVGHTVTADGGAFDSGPLSEAGTFTWDAAAAGEYDFHCAFHPSMTGTVTVVEPASSASTASALPSDPPTDASGLTGPAVPSDQGRPAAVIALSLFGLAVALVGRQRPWRVRGIGGRPRRPSTR